MITFSNVTKKYDNGTVALDNVSFYVERGEFAFIIGKSGAGKSTLTKLITCEERPTSGTITVNRLNVDKLPKSKVPYLRRTIGMVFQDFRLLPNKTVRENVAFAMEVIGASPRDIRRTVPTLLAMVGLGQKVNSYPDELSGGEQQRIAVARAIAADPEIILADEPPGNLNFSIGEAVIKQLIEISKGKTLIAVTHDERLAKYFDEVIDMNEMTDGRRDVVAKEVV